MAARGATLGLAPPPPQLPPLRPTRRSRSPARRTNSPRLPAHSADCRKAASVRTTRKRKGQRRKTRYPRRTRRRLALRTGSRDSRGSHPNAANDNRTCWHRPQKGGNCRPEAAVFPQRHLWLEGAQRRPRRKDMPLPGLCHARVCVGGQRLSLAGLECGFTAGATDASWTVVCCPRGFTHVRLNLS